MDKIFKHMDRLREQRRAAAIEERRNRVLLANSNCYGTTADLFSKQPRTVLDTKKVRQQSDSKYKPYKEIIPYGS